MKVLLLEYVSGGGLAGESLPPSLAREGALMRRALAHDLLAVPGVELILFNDARLPAPDLGGRAEVVAVGESLPFATAWRAALGRCEAVWPIAPETGGILEGLCRDVEIAGRALLGSPAAAVRLAASKLATIRRLQEHGLPTVPTQPWPGAELPGGPFVVKPDDGVGCEGARIVADLDGLAQAPGAWIVQPLLGGEALSLSALFHQGRARLLSLNRQIVGQAAGGFVLKACQVNALADPEGRWQALAEGIAAAVPELWGYAGVDLILTGQGPAILEINPRLTSSYAGLRQATGENPAAAVLELRRTGRLPPPRRERGKAVNIHLEA